MLNNISFNKLHSSSRLPIVVIFAYFLMVMRCWLGFGGRTQMMTYAFPFLMIAFIAMGKLRYEFKKRYAIFSIIVFVFGVIGVKAGSNINAYINQIFVPLNIYFVLSIPDDEKEHILSVFIKWFGWIMMLAIPLYLLSLVSLLPNIVEIMSDYGNEEVSAGIYSNYLVFINPLERNFESGFARFNGPFIEPGDLGCTAAFMLMAAKFDFKRYEKLVWILAGLLVSMSLAGYMLALIGYISVLFTQGKISGQRVALFITLCLGIYLFGTYYNGGDNFLYEKVLSRLQSDDETGFVGNNRNSPIKTEYFLMMFSDPHTLWFGYDSSTMEMLNESGLGAGFVNKALSVGMLGMLGLILPYLYIAKSSTTKKYAWFFFLFFLFYMYQRTESTWICYVLCYVYGIVINERDNSHIR